MRTCLTVLFSFWALCCCVSPSRAATPSGVVYAGDMQAIDRAVLESAALPLPSVSGPSTLTPRTAPQRPVAVMAPGAASPQRVVTVPGARGMTPTVTDGPGDAKKGSFLSRLKPSWLFGKSNEETAAEDPFLAAAQKSTLPKTTAPKSTAPKSLIQPVGAATPSSREQRVERIPSYVASQTSQQAAGQQPIAPSKLQPIPAGKSPRRGGIAMRKESGPRQGLLSGLFGGSEEKPQPTTPSPSYRTNGESYDASPKSASPRVGGQLASSAPKPTAAAKKLPAAPRPGGKATPSPTSVAKQAPKPSAGPKPTATPKGPSGVVMVSDAPTGLPKPSPSKPKPSLTITASAPTPLADPGATAAPQAKPSTPLVVESSMAMASSGPVAAEAAPAEEADPMPPRPTPAPLVMSRPSPPRPEPIAEPAPVEHRAPHAYVTTDQQLRPLTADAEPTERGKALLGEAHQLAATARTSEEFSAVLKRCRYVLAIDNSPQAVAYAKQLAGWALTKRGESFEAEGRMDEAEADFTDALRSDGECWRAEHALGVIAARHGDADSALRRFNRTLSLNPEFAKAYSNRAALSVQRGDYHSALRDYQQAIEIDPDFEVAHAGRGRVCHMLGLLEEGLRHLDAAELLAPDDAMIATGRGDLLVDLGRYGQAQEAYQRAITIDPQQPAAYRNLAWMQATCPVAAFRDGESALTNAERAEQLAGGADDLTLDTKAAALASQGRFEEAAELQQQAIEIAPATDAGVYRERLAMYQQGEAFTSKPVGVRQASYGATVR